MSVVFLFFGWTLLNQRVFDALSNVCIEHISGFGISYTPTVEDRQAIWGLPTGVNKSQTFRNGKGDWWGPAITLPRLSRAISKLVGPS